MWDEKPIEKLTRKLLAKECGPIEGGYVFSLYEGARNPLVKDVLDEIKAYAEKGLTDHSYKHVGNVLDKAWQLLNIKDCTPHISITGMDLYCLLMSILFHDVGNIFGRDDHQKNCIQIYDHVRSEADSDNNERHIIQSIVKAHCGKTPDGSYDTIQELGIGSEQIKGHPVHVCDIAAIVRFADELAEGPQRTSSFASEHMNIPDPSKIYHKYANSVHVSIHPETNRIVLKYYIDCPENYPLEDNGNPTVDELISFILMRVEKLNQERQYARYYTEWLDPYKKLEVSLFLNNSQGAISFTSETITDIVVPSKETKTLSKYKPDLSKDKIMKKLHQVLKDQEKGQNDSTSKSSSKVPSTWWKRLFCGPH